MPEAAKKSFDELLKDYRDLQLRVTKFSNVEQELINTRDKLDRELVAHRRLNTFIQNALKDMTNYQFGQLAAESIIDILEVEAAVVWFSNLGEGNKEVYFSEGLFEHVIELQTEMSSFFLKLQSEKMKLVSGEEFHLEVLQNAISETLLYVQKDNQTESSFFISAIISTENAPLYEKIGDRHQAIFSLFAQQLKSIYLNRLNSEKIREQVVQISKSERELRNLSLIATKTKNGVIIADNKGRIEWVNDAFVKITGYHLNEVKGKKPRDFLQSKNSDPKVLEKLSEALRNKENIEVTIINITREGTPYYNQLEITPVFDENGNHTNFIALQKDITAESVVKDELLRVNSRFELISQKSKIGIWEFDAVKNVVSWNDTLYEIYDLEKDKSIDLYKYWLDSIYIDDLERINKNTEDINSGLIDFVEQEYRITLKNSGEIKFLVGITIAEKDEFGSIIRIVGSSIDVTERKQNEKLILEQNETLKKNLIEIEKGKVEIEKINQNLEKLVFEKTEKNVELAKSIADQEKLVTIGEIASGVAHDLNTPLGSIKIGAESITYTLNKLVNEVIPKCSEEQIVFANNRSLTTESTLFIGGLQLRQEMRKFGDYIKLHFPEFTVEKVYSLAELFVKSNIKIDEEILIKDILSTDNSIEFLNLIYHFHTLRGFINTIIFSGEKAAKVVQDLRSFIKDQRNADMVKVNIKENIASVINVFNYEIKKKCELSFKVDPNLEIEGYEVRLFQLWSNLIKNAIEAIDDNQKRGLIQIYSEKTNNGFLIALENNGPKIPEEIQSKIFHKFYTTKATKNGSGIGLSIVKKIVDEHHAQISLESNDEFTRFTIQFSQ
jgi:PAS domain S-box-containing protein